MRAHVCACVCVCRVWKGNVPPFRTPVNIMHEHLNTLDHFPQEADKFNSLVWKLNLATCKAEGDADCNQTLRDENTICSIISPALFSFFIIMYVFCIAISYRNVAITSIIITIIT